MPDQSIEDLYVSVGVDISKALNDTKEGVGKIEKELTGIEKSGKKSFTGAGKSAKGFGGVLSGLKTQILAVGTALLAAFSIRAVSNFFKKSIAFVKESVGLTKVQIAAEQQLKAVLESTGYAAGMSASELKKLTTEMQNVTNYGDEAVLQGENMLLTFTKIGRDVFPRATKAMLDVATAMKQDVKTSAIQVGKALNDPIKGLANLSRVGIQFTDQQKELIKSLAETGDVAGAQAIILEELERQFGGSAEAARKADGGFQALANQIGDFREVLGKNVLESTSKSVEKLLDIITDKEVKSSLENLASAFGEVAGYVTELVTAPALQALEDIDPESINNLAEALRRATDAIGEFLDFGAGADINTMIDSLTTLADTITILVNSANRVNEAIPGLNDFKKGILRILSPIKNLSESISALNQISEHFTGKELVDISTDLAKSTETVAQKMERARKAEADRYQGMADMYAAQEAATKSNDDFNDSLEETEEISKKAADALDNYASDLLDLSEDTQNAIADLEQGHTQRMTDIQDEYTSAMAEAEQERTSALAEAEQERTAAIAKAEQEHTKAMAEAAQERTKALADLEQEVTKERTRIIKDAEQELSDLAADTNRTLEKERDSFNRDELRQTEDHLDSMRQLRQRYLESLEGAVKSRDARALVDARRQYQQQQSEAETNFQTQQGRRKEDENLRLREIRENEQLKANEIMQAQEEELLALIEHEAEKRDQIQESYQEQTTTANEAYQEQKAQAEAAYQEQTARAEAAYQEQAERAQAHRDEELAKEEENYQKEKEQLENQIADRLETIAKGLADQDDITDEEAAAILATLANYFGVGGEIDKLMEEFANRRRAKIQIQVAYEAGGKVTPPGAPPPPVAPPAYSDVTAGGGGLPSMFDKPVPFQHGGAMIARRPTLAMFGETPELAQFTPLSQMNNNVDMERTINLKVELSGSAPPGIRSADRDAIASVLVNALRESGLRVMPGR